MSGTSKRKRLAEILSTPEGREKHLRVNLEMAEEELSALQARLTAMTEDRDLWQAEHNKDCPNLTRLALAMDLLTQCSVYLTLWAKPGNELLRDVDAFLDASPTEEAT